MRRLVLDGLLPTGETVAAPWRTRARSRSSISTTASRRSPTARCSRSRAAGAGSSCATSRGFPCAQVFAPPDKDLICFEPMTAPADALRTGAFAVAAPGRPYRAAFTITVDRK